ncbi:MAG: Sua5/YciO/YrdC/YwlC family protein [Gammaproteobacteria bacterium]|nr:Sua5/YciO/YrdC/YwlC family protein [Gammaproteobacteria bacterium]
MLKKSDQIIKVLQQGGIILYPTEGVYGLGCDPFNETAVLRLLKIKRRDVKQGLILIAANWDQVKDLINLDLKKCKKITEKDSYPITWIFPATKKAPRWITGKFNSIAIRVTSHLVAKNICQGFGGPIVSTSANLSKSSPIKKLSQLDKKVINSIDYVFSGRVGTLGKPTQICEFKTGKIIRS